MIRKRSIKKQFNYEHEDETPKTSKNLFRINFFYVLLEQTLNSLEQRYEQLVNHNDYFDFLYNLKKIGEYDQETLKEKCQILGTYLTDKDDKDIVCIELFNELISFKDLFLSKLLKSSEANDFATPLSTLKYIYENNLESLYVNLCIALRISLTQPVSVASGERSFSRLKLLKTYLRLKISQDRLVGLALISIESDVCDQLDIQMIINDFAALKARKVVIF